MEIGAVKQAFNNELILLKKKLNQAKIQIIHKLTRKAKTLSAKKVPAPLQEKFKRKAEAAVQEVLIIKKLKVKDVARFVLTHTGKLNNYLNKPIMDLEKACARLLLHKTIIDKYSFLRDRFSNIPIDDLFMSKLERKKKEEMEKKTKKEKGKKQVSNQGDWYVEDVSERVVDNVPDSDEEIIFKKGSLLHNKNEHEYSSDDAIEASSNDEKKKTEISEENLDKGDSDTKISVNDSWVKTESTQQKKIKVPKNYQNKIIKAEANGEQNLVENENDESDIVPGKFVRLLTEISSKQSQKSQAIVTSNVKHKPTKSKKNLNEKIASRTFKKQEADSEIVNNKVVDPFFITSTGDNYMSLVEPRQPDEVKEIHKQGNRQMRRAAMFGHVPRIKPRFNSNANQNNFNNYKDNKMKQFINESNYETDGFIKNKGKFNKNDKHLCNRSNQEYKEEKLHPSWEAKRKKSGILPFEGKKIVFDDS